MTGRGAPRAAPSAREVARRVLDRVAQGGAWATLTLDGELARAGLDERDRRLAAELVYGVLRHRARLDHALAAHADLRRTPPRVLTALRVAAHQLLFLARVPGYAAVDDAVDATRALGGGGLAGFVNAVLRKLAAGGEPPLPGAPGSRRRLEVECSLPPWILGELAAALGDDARLPEAAAAFAAQAPLVLRANPRRTTREALVATLAGEGAVAVPHPATEAALVVEGLGDPGRSASFAAGLWTVQDAGAQRVAVVAAPRRGDRVLDACAGVGGKASHLAELADDQVAIDAADQSTTKLALCARSAARLGLRGIRTVAADLTAPGADLAGAYDLVVLDAPCTGLGVLRRHPDAKWRMSPGDVPRLAGLQAQLLDALAPRVAPGGALVYSVCSFARAEGPEQIAAFLARAPGFVLAHQERTWPHEGADAFYLARLERRA